MLNAKYEVVFYALANYSTFPGDILVICIYVIVLCFRRLRIISMIPLLQFLFCSQIHQQMYITVRFLLKKIQII